MSASRNIVTLAQGLRELVDLEGGRRDIPGILSRAAELACRHLGVTSAFAATAVESVSLVSMASRERAIPGGDPWEGAGALGRHILETGKSFLWRVGDQPEPSPIDFQGFPGVSTWAGIPFRLPNEGKGLLVALADGTQPVDGEDMNILEVIAAYTATALGNCVTYQKTEALALTDELTRLYNFRFLKTALRREMERASRYGQVFSVIMIDVDHLKRYNEKHGHLGGSELLRRLAAILSRSSRAIDLVAKYGGDEFMVILPQTRLEGAVSMANRIRAAVAATAFPHSQPGDLTISVGVACYPQHGDTIESLVAASDKALFSAKGKNRNCVVAADIPGADDSVPEAA